jgi:catechol 2,3-dioxygenase-like lactoylglutathione lyase family enzyme
MIQSIAFLAYPVSDLKAARHFYEDILGLKLTHEFGNEWFEYDIGDTTFAINAADAEHPVPVRGAVLALEVSDLNAEVARLRERGVTFRGEIAETPVCRFAVVLDPDDSEVIIHQRKETLRANEQAA